MRVPLSPTTCLADGGAGSERAYRVTPFLEAAAFYEARAGKELRAKSAQFEGAVFFETANTPNSPDNPVGFPPSSPSWKNAEGVDFPGAFVDLSAYTDGKQLIRWGFWARRASGSALEFAQMMGMVEGKKKA